MESDMKPPRSKKAKGSEEEEEYEIVPREAEWKEDLGNTSGKIHYRLPLKTGEGLILQEPVTLEEREDSETDQSGIEDNEDNEISLDEFDGLSDNESQENELLSDKEQKMEEEVPAAMSTVQVLAQREKKLNKKKEQIAAISSQVIEDPQANVGLLKKLYWLCNERIPEIALSVRKLAMVSLMSVYKDIIPSYRIRELTAVERTVKVSKDVLKLRKYEESLLKYYDSFIGLLDTVVQVGLNDYLKSKKKKLITNSTNIEVEMLDSGLTLSKSALEGLGEVALKCLCELGIVLNHFNFYMKVFTIITQQMVSTGSEKILTLCYEAISKTFANDIIGDVSLEIVRLITKLIKSRGYHTKPELLKTFLSLNLYNVSEPVDQYGSTSSVNKKTIQARDEKRKAKLERQRMTRKQRRKLHARHCLEKELREAEAEERVEKKSKLQTETIKLVFWTYFRVLKYSQDSPLLGVVLEGLAKFAHLISVDYFADLMSVLHSLMEKQSLSTQQTLQCTLTAFQILSGQGESLNIDPREFYCQLYVHLLQLDYRTDQYNMSLALNCLEKISKHKKNISYKTVVGFVKRIATMCLQLPPSSCLALMGTLRQFLLSYSSQCELLLENDEDSVSNLFRPDVPDPELSGSSSTMLWEIATLKKHYDPYVSNYAQHLLKGAPSQGSGSLQSQFSRMNTIDLMKVNIWHNANPFDTIPSKPVIKKTKKVKLKTIRD